MEHSFTDHVRSTCRKRFQARSHNSGMRPWCVHTCRRRTRSRSIDLRRVAVIPASRVPIGQFAARFARYRVTKDVVEEACCLDDARPPAITHRRPPPRNHGVGRPIRIIDKYRYFSLHAAPGPTTDGKITYE